MKARDEYVTPIEFVSNSTDIALTTQLARYIKDNRSEGAHDMPLRITALLGLVLWVLAACTAREPVEPPVPPQLSTYAPIGKLPGNARPLAYDVHMHVDPREAAFYGDVTITVELDDEASGVWLHGDDIRVSSVEISAPQTPDQKTSGTWEEVLETGVARIGFAKNFGPGIINVRIVYEADFDENLAGLFRVEDGDDAYALAKSESIQARRFLPGFDEPAYKAPFDILLTVPEGMTAISNAPTFEEVQEEDGMKSVRFARTRPLPTYLLSVAVGPFDIVDAGVLPPNSVRAEPIPLRGITRKGRAADIARAIEVTPPLMEIFEEEFRQPYPFKKLDIIAAPAWPSGATELAGAITYRESRILLNERSGPAAEAAMLRIHTHEIAHMWFGNLVTPPWWDDLWLKEAFATWGTPLSLELFQPEAGHGLDAVRRALSAMRLDSLAAVRAVREPIERNEDVRNAYDAITYSKGMAIIRMMDEYFGAEAFRPALGRYVEQYEDGVADSPAFFDVIGQVSGEPRLTEAFRSFVEQKGVPRIDITDVQNEDGDLQFRVRQSRYVPLGSKIDGQPLWTIPVCAKVAGRETPACQIIDTRDAVVRVLGAGDTAWIMPNARAQGYYRFNLPTEMWRALAADFDKLSTGEQMSVVDSAFAMFEAGALDAEIVKLISEAASRADNRNVVTAPMSSLSRYVRMVSGDERAVVQTYLMSLYEPPLLDARRRSGDDAILLDGAITGFLAFTAEAQRYREETVSRARAYFGLDGAPDSQALLSDEYRDAFTLFVQDGGEEAFTLLSSEVEARSDATFTLAAASALGSTRVPELAAIAREHVLEGKFGPREAYSIIANQMAEPLVREEAWIWLQENYPSFLERIPRQWPRRTPGLFESFCDADRLSELEELFEQYGELAPGYEAALSQMRERLELCSALKSAKVGEFVTAVSAAP